MFGGILYIIIAIVIAFAVGVYQQLKRRQQHQGSLEEDDADYFFPAFVAGCLWPITICCIFMWIVYLGYVKLVKYFTAKLEIKLENLHYKSECDIKSKS